jgi:broad specificity phosphatase PhoE
MRLTLLRHGESIKNLEDRHGGVGKGLTDRGRTQIINFTDIIKPFTVAPIRVFHSNIIQTSETAEIIGKNLNCPIIYDDRIKPLNIGLLDGLSREEASLKFPEIAKLMEAWRNGEIEINQLKIPESENLLDFWNRGTFFINDLKKSDGLNIVVGTRSILILLISIAVNRSILPGGGYKEIVIQNSNFITFDYLDNNFVLNNSLSNFNI